MLGTLLFFLAMFALTALAEFLVLKRCYGRRSVPFCVVSVAVFSGVGWMAIAVSLAHIHWGWKAASEPSLSASEWATPAFLILLDVLLLSALALVPAGSVALIFRRWRGQT
jgi:hypothetical protein